jgi:hypothetical protein
MDVVLEQTQERCRMKWTQMIQGHQEQEIPPRLDLSTAESKVKQAMVQVNRT